MLKPWMVIAAVTFGIALLANILRPKDIKWFRRLERPNWLTFEKLVPLIWSVIFVFGAVSAHQVWQQDPGSSTTWALMAGYISLELLVVAFSPVLLWSRNLLLATGVGLLGLAWGVGLTIWVAIAAGSPALLLLPYLLWGLTGSYITWSMRQLNNS